MPSIQQMINEVVNSQMLIQIAEKATFSNIFNIMLGLSSTELL